MRALFVPPECHPPNWCVFPVVMNDFLMTFRSSPSKWPHLKVPLNTKRCVGHCPGRCLLLWACQGLVHCSFSPLFESRASTPWFSAAFWALTRSPRLLHKPSLWHIQWCTQKINNGFSKTMPATMRLRASGSWWWTCSRKWKTYTKIMILFKLSMASLEWRRVASCMGVTAMWGKK